MSRTSKFVAAVVLGFTASFAAVHTARAGSPWFQQQGRRSPGQQQQQQGQRSPGQQQQQQGQRFPQRRVSSSESFSYESLLVARSVRIRSTRGYVSPWRYGGDSPAFPVADGSGTGD